MTTLFSGDFESGEFSAWTSYATSGALANVVSTLKHSGNYCCKVSGLTAQGNYFYAIKIIQNASFYAGRLYIQFTQDFALSTSLTGLIQFIGTSNRWLVQLNRLANGSYQWVLVFGLGGSVAASSSAFTLNLNQWYCVELDVLNSATSTVTVYINGSQAMQYVGSNSIGSFNNFAIEAYANLNNSNAGVVYFDDCVVADTYIGPLSVSISLYDSFSLTDNPLRNKPSLAIIDSIGLGENCAVPARLKQILDSVAVSEGVLVSRVLVIDDNAIIVETVEKSAPKKTRLFLVLGDLAIQLTGD